MPAQDITVMLDPDMATQRRISSALQKLPNRILERIVGTAASFAMKPMVKAAKANLAGVSKTGTLRKSIGIKKKMYRNNGVVFVVVGPQKGFKDPETNEDPIKIAHLVEFGTRAHKITAKQKGLTIGSDVIRGDVDHPGAKKTPFMRRAFDGYKHQAVRRYRQKMAKGVDKQVKKLAVK